MIKVFGLKNCDTCRNVLKWLNNSGFIHEFHDIRDNKIDADAVNRWILAVGLDSLLNTRSTTWRGLPDEKNAVTHDFSPEIVGEPDFDKTPGVRSWR